MRPLKKRSKLFLLFSAIVIAAFLLVPKPRTTPIEDAVTIELQSFTNLPTTDRKFALLKITNRAEYDVRWHGDWVEIESSPVHHARICNSLLPGQTYTPVLKSGQSFILNVGDPNFEPDTNRWRFVTTYTRYDLRQKWFDLSLRGKIPNQIGRTVLVDSQKILDPSTYTHATTLWIIKSSGTGSSGD